MGTRSMNMCSNDFPFISIWIFKQFCFKDIVMWHWKCQLLPISTIFKFSWTFDSDALSNEDTELYPNIQWPRLTPILFLLTLVFFLLLSSELRSWRVIPTHWSHRTLLYFIYNFSAINLQHSNLAGGKWGSSMVKDIYCPKPHFMVPFE